MLARCTAVWEFGLVVAEGAAVACLANPLKRLAASFVLGPQHVAEREERPPALYVEAPPPRARVGYVDGLRQRAGRVGSASLLSVTEGGMVFRVAAVLVEA
jgi:hypothetical protein